jgi:hypothetical protein
MTATSWLKSSRLFYELGQPIAPKLPDLATATLSLSLDPSHLKSWLAPFFSNASSSATAALSWHFSLPAESETLSTLAPTNHPHHVALSLLSPQGISNAIPLTFPHPAPLFLPLIFSL